MSQSSISTLSAISWEEFAREARAAIADARVSGVIVRADAALGGAGYPSDVAGFGDVLRQIETGGKPFVAAISGAASGAVCEISAICVAHPFSWKILAAASMSSGEKTKSDLFWSGMADP